MTTRSRYQEYCRLRREHFGCVSTQHRPGPTIKASKYDLPFSEDVESDARPLHGAMDAKIDMIDMNPASEAVTALGLPSRWADVIADVHDVLKEIQTRMDALAGLQRKHLTCQFGASNDEEVEEQDIDVKTRSIAQLFKELEQLIVYLEKLVKEDQRVGFDAQRRMVLNMKIGMVGSANELSRSFRAAQRVYLQKMTKMKQKRSRFQSLTVGSSTDKVLSELDREEVVERYLEQGFTQEQVEMMIVQEKATKERDEELRRIVSSITDLHDMFRDINVMVVEQGSVLDQIDHNLSTARERITAGVQQLEKANEYQSQTKWKLLFMMVLFLIALCALVIVGKFMLKAI